MRKYTQILAYTCTYRHTNTCNHVAYTKSIDLQVKCGRWSDCAELAAQLCALLPLDSHTTAQQRQQIAAPTATTTITQTKTTQKKKSTSTASKSSRTQYKAYTSASTSANNGAHDDESQEQQASPRAYHHGQSLSALLLSADALVTVGDYEVNGKRDFARAALCYKYVHTSLLCACTVEKFLHAQIFCSISFSLSLALFSSISSSSSVFRLRHTQLCSAHSVQTLPVPSYPLSCW